eukprot:TRINITY_DN2364_c0_g3_i1.p1 TRINITY_DN2364_c0_g3~~TRINITY_DN2364_c0_g3_i1.p1  ORF type:complete len:263 (-),score=59.70 TRINITY_DN2364_c0_g3_i1:68-856(-)
MGTACCNNESRVTADSKIINNQYKTDYHSTNYLNNPFQSNSSRNHDNNGVVNEYKKFVGGSGVSKEGGGVSFKGETPLIYDCEGLDLCNEESPHKNKRGKRKILQGKKTVNKEFANVKSRYMNYESPSKKGKLVNFTASFPLNSTSQKWNPKEIAAPSRTSSLKRNNKDINLIMNKNHVHLLLGTSNSKKFTPCMNSGTKKTSAKKPQLAERKYESPRMSIPKMVEPVSVISNCSSKLTLKLDDLIAKSEKSQVAVYNVQLP